MAGDRETAVMVMRMEEGVDTGPVCLTDRTPIDEDETAGDLRERLSRSGADLMVQALEKLEKGDLTCIPQSNSGVAYAAKIDKSEARIDWQRPAVELHNQIWGLSPSPGAWCELSRKGGKERMKILRASRSAGAWIARNGALCRSAPYRVRQGRAGTERGAARRKEAGRRRRIPARRAPRAWIALA